LLGVDDLIGSVVRVGDGRGFVVVAAANYDTCYVITAAHCLPQLPPPHLMSYLEERTYLKLIGPLGQEPQIAAECLFADPVADLAVLGEPDNQELSEEQERYGAFTTALPPFDIAAPPPRNRLRMEGLWVGSSGIPSRPISCRARCPFRPACYRSKVPGSIAQPAITADRW
jgi:hypothetical protein